MNKVERVARAICVAVGHDDPDRMATMEEPETCDGLFLAPHINHPAWSFYCKQAEAAINEVAKASKVVSIASAVRPVQS